MGDIPSPIQPILSCAIVFITGSTPYLLAIFTIDENFTLSNDTHFVVYVVQLG